MSSIIPSAPAEPVTASPPHYPSLSTDALARDRTIAARDRIREASAYLARMVTQFGAGHPDTAHAQRLVDDANLTAAQLGEATR